MRPTSESVGSGSGRFEATRWSVVLRAAREAAAQAPAQNALAQLCGTYWPPVYGFIRRRGHCVHDAQDLAQGFFCHLIEHRIYARADPAKGKFRSFLLVKLPPVGLTRGAGGRRRGLTADTAMTLPEESRGSSPCPNHLTKDY